MNYCVDSGRKKGGLSTPIARSTQRGLLLLLTNSHLKLLSTQGTGADKLLSTQRVKHSYIHRQKLLIYATHLYMQADWLEFKHRILMSQKDCNPISM